VRLKAGSAYQDRNLVFATRVGTPINPSNLRNRSFVPLLKKAGLPHITFHDLRHTTASLLFSKNVHPKFVQELSGTLPSPLPWTSTATAARHGRRGRRRNGRSPRVTLSGVRKGQTKARPFLTLKYFPAKLRFSKVGDAGFEPATSSL
jgi:hypothetical protein